MSLTPNSPLSTQSSARHRQTKPSSLQHPRSACKRARIQPRHVRNDAESASQPSQRDFPLSMKRWIKDDEQNHFVGRMAKYTAVPKHKHIRPRHGSDRHTGPDEKDSECKHATDENKSIILPSPTTPCSQDISLLHVGSWCTELENKGK